MVDVADIKRRAAVREAVSTCTRCNLRSVATKPVPFTGSPSSLLTCVGEAPGRTEDAENKPFMGKAGQLLRSWLADAGFADGEVSYVNAVSCWPNRTPTGKEIVACRANLMMQLAYLKPRYILALGGVSLNALLTPISARIGDLRGKWFRAEGFGVSPAPYTLATWHPAAVLRNRTLEAKATEDILYVRLMIERGIEPGGDIWCWYPDCCNNNLDGPLKGLYSCQQHPLKIDTPKPQKKVPNDRSRDSAGGSGNVHQPSGNDDPRLL